MKCRQLYSVPMLFLEFTTTPIPHLTGQKRALTVTTSGTHVQITHRWHLTSHSVLLKFLIRVSCYPNQSCITLPTRIIHVAALWLCFKGTARRCSFAETELNQGCYFRFIVWTSIRKDLLFRKYLSSFVLLPHSNVSFILSHKNHQNELIFWYGKSEKFWIVVYLHLL